MLLIGICLREFMIVKITRKKKKLNFIINDIEPHITKQKKKFDISGEGLIAVIFPPHLLPLWCKNLTWLKWVEQLIQYTPYIVHNVLIWLVYFFNQQFVCDSRNVLNILFGHCVNLRINIMEFNKVILATISTSSILHCVRYHEHQRFLNYND